MQEDIVAKNYIINNPDLMQEWDWNKNNELNICPQKITTGSHIKAWWICEKGHSWNALVSNRARLNRKCPYCAKQIPIPNENDLATTNPELAIEWHPTKNVNVTPHDVMNGSHKKVWWKCKRGHEWQAIIKNRTKGADCPICANKVVVSGENDLATTHPLLAKMWHPTKNGELTPQDVTYGSGKTVWWICKNGHEFRRKIDAHRAIFSCPICSSRRRTSFPEQAIFYYVKQFFPDAINSYKEIFETKSMELDIFIPSLKIGVEFDGKEFHKNDCNKLRDLKKYTICKKHDIYLIRVTDTTIENHHLYCDHKIEILNCKIENLNNGIKELLLFLGSNAVPNINKDRYKILSYLTATDKSLLTEEPQISAEWNYEKNGQLSPAMFHPGSCEKVWWKCARCGYEWITAISERTGHDKTGCPHCATEKRVSARQENFINTNGSLSQTYPELLKEWDYENNVVNPDNIHCKSHNKVWWKCNICGYKWKTTIYHRTCRNSGCPCCKNRVVVAGINDLATTHPHLLEEWNTKKNIDTTPETYTYGSNNKVWWKCSKCGYEYLCAISSKTSSNHNKCPQCAKLARLSSFASTILKKNGSFGDNCPELLKTWDFCKNTVDPFSVVKCSNLKVWWKCSTCGNEWAATIRSQSISRKCPQCAKKNRDLKKQKPVLQFTKNGVFIKRYASVKDASKEFKNNRSAITSCCKGKTKTAYGYIWKYEV